jgi:diacylglycerol diphosphate phosphatase/phosphatidate phosphatase
MVGRPRPDFMARCDPIDVTKMLEGTNCRGDPHLIQQGRKSFPSGHTSRNLKIDDFTSDTFQGVMFIALFWAHEQRVFARGRPVQIIPIILVISFAIYVGLTRFEDHRHHWQDSNVLLPQLVI